MNAATNEDSLSLKYVADFGSLLPWLSQTVHFQFGELRVPSGPEAAIPSSDPGHVLTLAALHVSERLVRQFFDDSPIGVVVFEPVGRLVRVNEAFCAMLGCAPDDLRERNIEELMHPEDVPASQEHRRRLLEGACSRFEVETRFARAHRPEIWTRVCGRLERYAVDQPPLIFAHVVEISEPKCMQEERQRAMEAMLLRNWTPDQYMD